MTNTDIEHGTDGTELELMEGYNESRVYELGFHIDPELPQEEVKKTYQTIREHIEKGGKVIAEGQPQSIQLAYTISRQETTGRRDFNGAYFAWIAYEADTVAHDAVLEAVKSDSRIFRFIDLKTTAEAAEHSAEMQELYLKAQAEAKAAETDEDSDVSDTELDAALEGAGVA